MGTFRLQVQTKPITIEMDLKQHYSLSTLELSPLLHSTHGCPGVGRYNFGRLRCNLLQEHACPVLCSAALSSPSLSHLLWKPGLFDTSAITNMQRRVSSL